MLILKGWRERGTKKEGKPSRGNIQTPKSSQAPSMLYFQRPQSKPTTVLPLTETLPHISLLSQPWSHDERCWHMPALVYELVTTAKAAWPKACSLFIGSFKLQKGIFFFFFGFLSIHWGGLLKLLLPTWASSKDFSGDYALREAINIIQCRRISYPFVQSREKFFKKLY